MDLRLSERDTRRLSPRALMRMLRRHTQLRDQERKAANLRAGLVASVIVNVHGGKAEPGDFFRDPDDDSQYMTPEQTAAHWQAFAVAHNAAQEKRENADKAP